MNVPSKRLMDHVPDFGNMVARLLQRPSNTIRRRNDFKASLKANDETPSPFIAPRRVNRNRRLDRPFERTRPRLLLPRHPRRIRPRQPQHLREPRRPNRPRAGPLSLRTNPGRRIGAMSRRHLQFQPSPQRHMFTARRRSGMGMTPARTAPSPARPTKYNATSSRARCHRG
jgi:hypothetical protein